MRKNALAAMAVERQLWDKAQAPTSPGDGGNHTAWPSPGTRYRDPRAWKADKAEADEEAKKTQETPVTTTPVKKTKKKKKISYKNMMNGMLTGSEKSVDKEKEKLRQVVGGGNFTKVDKI